MEVLVTGLIFGLICPVCDEERAFILMSVVLSLFLWFPSDAAADQKDDAATLVCSEGRVLCADFRLRPRIQLLRYPNQQLSTTLPKMGFNQRQPVDQCGHRQVATL